MAAENVAKFDLTKGIVVDANDVIYLANPRNHRIRRIVMNNQYHKVVRSQLNKQTTTLTRGFLFFRTPIIT